MSWHKKFMGLAKHISVWSKDPSTHVGAVIVGEDREIIATGYNGFPRGVDDNTDRLSDRETRLMFSTHAERNAVFNAARVGVSTKDCTMYVYGLPPCTGCAQAIIQSGITSLVINERTIPERWKKECETALLMLSEAGVQVYTVDELDNPVFGPGMRKPLTVK